MKEQHDILRLWTRLQAAGEKAVLATVVKTAGSSYRNPGARLLISSTGLRAGSVSGGCLEDDLTKRAFWLTQYGPTVRRYDTTADGEIDTGGFGMGCNGTVFLLLERISEKNTAVLDMIAGVRSLRRPAAIAHRIDAENAGHRLVFGLDGKFAYCPPGALYPPILEEEARAVLAELRSRLVAIDGAEFFIEVIAPPPRLLIFGAGDDAVPLSSAAKLLGWVVEVFDGRKHYARPEKFPDAEAVHLCAAGEAGATAPVDAWTAAVLMSHSYSQDLANLRELAGRGLRYLGILGPRKRTERLLDESGLGAGKLRGLFAPMGLDIGADGPEQVALSVVAEIQAVFNGRSGGLLRNRRGPIHAAGEQSPAPPRPLACI
jgi:xanthine dehydrogenase accessory factor